MSRWVRTLLMCFLVLAVPAQRAAATSMAFCGAGHHGGATALPLQQAALINHAHHDHSVSAKHEHPRVDARADDDSAASPSTATGGEHGTHKCSACASCCSAGALLSSMLALPAPDFTLTVFSTVVPGVDTFAADSPDRPPRIVRA